MDPNGGNPTVTRYTWSLDLAGQAGAGSEPRPQGSGSFVAGRGGPALQSAGGIGGLLDQGGVGVPARLVERYDYDPYGTTYISCRQGQTFVPCDTSHYGNPFMWTGQRYDSAVGLYHFLFRTYSPTLGRWMQRDPVGYVDGVSLYQYCGSRATTLVDPFGLLPPPGMGGEGGTWFPPIAPPHPGGGPTGDPCGGDLPPVPNDPRIPGVQPPGTPQEDARQILVGLHQIGFSMELWALWLNAMRQLGNDDWRASFERFMQAYLRWLEWMASRGAGSDDWIHSGGITDWLQPHGPLEHEGYDDDSGVDASALDLWLARKFWLRYHSPEWINSPLAELELVGAAGSATYGATGVVRFLFPSGQVLVAKWGSPIGPGSWVMVQGPGLISYVLSGKWQPSSWWGGNMPALFNDVFTKPVLGSQLHWPPGVVGAMKALLGQRIYWP